MFDRLRKKLGKDAEDVSSSAPVAAAPPDRGHRPDPDDVLKELGSTADARTDAETLLAEATYNLKRGNREKDPHKKLELFKEALVRFERLHELLPGERTIQEQYAKLSRGVEEMESIIARYADEAAAKAAGGGRGDTE